MREKKPLTLSDTIHDFVLCQYVIVFSSLCLKPNRYMSVDMFFLSHIRVVERSGSLSVQGLKPYRRYNVKAVIEVFNLTSTENDRTISQNITTQDESQCISLTSILQMSKVLGH